VFGEMQHWEERFGLEEGGERFDHRGGAPIERTGRESDRD
jgi:hypothetical protein